MKTVTNPERTHHQQRVEQFMLKAGQETPDRPTIPSAAIRLLRAKLIFEEAVRELIVEGLAVDVEIGTGHGSFRIDADTHVFFSVAEDREPDLVKIADGVCDTSVVCVGTLSACGIEGKKIQQAVDEANLAKFSVPWCPDCSYVMTHESNGWFCTNPECDRTDPLPHNAGGYKSDGTDGNTKDKWIKPADWKAPDIAGILKEQGA